jgi:hypothetical protein
MDIDKLIESFLNPEIEAPKNNKKSEEPCIHGQHKNDCRICLYYKICKHDIKYYLCQECGGNRKCMHKIYKRLCWRCKLGLKIKIKKTRKIKEPIIPFANLSPDIPITLPLYETLELENLFE